MTDATAAAERVPLAPRARLSPVAQVRALRQFHTGGETVRDSSGPVVLLKVGLRRFGGHFAFVTSPQAIHDVLGGTDGSIDKEMIVHQESRAWGSSIFNLPHQPWLPRRRSLQPLFTKRRVSSYAQHMCTAAEVMAQSWSAGAGTDVDLDEQMRELTLRTLGVSVFGLDLGDRSSDLGPHFSRVLRWVTNRAVRPVRAPTWLPTPARGRFRASRAEIRTVLDEAIAACRANPDHGSELIRQLVATLDLTTGQPLTDEQIRDELFTFAIAGHDTTSTTLTYTLWQLGRDRDMQDRVAHEVAALGDRPLTVDDVASLPYTAQVLHEALRLCPPAAVVGRMAMSDVIADGYRIPAGTNILVGIYAVHRDPALWANATEFDPDRFAPDRRGAIDRWQYLPFGGGPRSCIGDHFAILEATLALAILIRSAEVTSEQGTFPVALPFTMTPDGPIRARVVPRRR